MKTDLRTAICILEDVATEYGGRTVDNVLSNLKAIQAHREANGCRVDNNTTSANMRVKVDVRHLNDLYKLGCVCGTREVKNKDDMSIYVQTGGKMSIANNGDWLVCENGKWRVEKGGKK